VHAGYWWEEPEGMRSLFRRRRRWEHDTGCVSEWAILQHCFFWFGNTGADAAIAILLPTLRRFSCNGAVDWSRTCFCVKAF
jgi:hypothetical protein